MDTLDRELDQIITQKPARWEHLFNLAVERIRTKRKAKLSTRTIEISKELLLANLEEPIEAFGSSTPDINNTHNDTHNNTTDQAPENQQDVELSDDYIILDELRTQTPQESRPTQTPHTTQQESEDELGIDLTGEYDTLDEIYTHTPQPSPFIPRPLSQRKKPLTPHTSVTTPQRNTTQNNTPTQSTLLSHLAPQLSAPALPQPTTKSFRVNRHLSTLQKQLSWKLEIKRPKIFIGDSNLCRMVQHNIQNLQIDSYPGASFVHTESLITRSTSTCIVDTIVLAFGLNNRNSKVKETTVKLIQKTLRATREKYPGSKIYIPIINYSTTLKPAEKATLKELNTYIEKHYTFIPPIPMAQFHTTTDRIHWTPDTAQNILTHWLNYLNLATP